MRFFALLSTFGLVALVAAQDASSTKTSAPAASSSIDPQIGCLQKCGSADVCCQAACVNVPCPNQQQIDATTECAAQCPQGNGTAAETEAYAACQSACISSNFLVNTATVSPTGTAGASGTATFGDSSATATGSGSGGASGTSGSAGAAETGTNGADSLHVGAVGLGFLGLVVAGLAL